MVDGEKIRANFLVDVEIWELFIDKCVKQDSDASKELRKFVKKYIEE